MANDVAIGPRLRIPTALFVVVAATATIGAGLGLTGSRATATPTPDAMVLKASQVGAGYRSQVIGNGRQVAGQVTLDLCYYTYPSESLRTARLQVGYLKAAHEPAISDEIVVYRNGGAAEALGELRLAVKHCPATPRTGPTAGERIPVTWHLTPITVAHLAPQYVAVRADVTAVVNGKRQTQTGVIIYEFAGNVMSAVYGYANGATAAATLALTVHAAQESAQNLRAQPA
jgi:hypothetical protein